MARRPFSTSPSYSRYIRGIRDIHALIAAGRDDTPEADAIRDGMDHPWYDLSETEQARLKGLSADLYSISNPRNEPLPPNPQVQRKLTEADEAWRAGKWDQALGILRRWSNYIDPALLSSKRGLLWQAAGDDTTAALFFDHATRLDPTNPSHRTLYLSAIQKSDSNRASSLAQEIISSDETHPPEVVVTAVRIVLETAWVGNPGSPGPAIAQLIPVLERALSRLQSVEHDRPPWFESFYVMATFTLGYCQAQTGDIRAAIRYLDLAIAADPNDWTLLCYRGRLRYGVDASGAEDFGKAIQLGSTDYDPYFFLAHLSVVNGRFEDCLKMCERALTFPARDEIRAFLHEWLGISRAQLGFPPDHARSAFEEAIRLAPDSDRIRDNLATFEKTLVSPGGPKPDWIKPKASTVQAFDRSNFRPPRPSSPLAA